MKSFRRWKVLLATLVVFGLALVARVQAGCCLIVSLDELPGQVVAGEPLELTFSARLLSQMWPGWEGTITAVHAESGQSVSVEVVATDETGRYRATLVLPAAGVWRWSVNERAMPPLTVQAPPVTAAEPADNQSPAMPVATVSLVAGVVGLLATAVGLLAWFRGRKPYQLAFVLAAAVVATGGLAVRTWAPNAALAEQTTAIPAIAPENMGEALFVAKGCVTCHRHDGVTISNSMAEIGPNLTHYQGNPEFLRQWLSDPKAIRPDTFMPDLALDEDEIEALVDFLSADSR